MFRRAFNKRLGGCLEGRLGGYLGGLWVGCLGGRWIGCLGERLGGFIRGCLIEVNFAVCKVFRTRSVLEIDPAKC